MPSIERLWLSSKRLLLVLAVGSVLMISAPGPVDAATVCTNHTYNTHTHWGINPVQYYQVYRHWHNRYEGSTLNHRHHYAVTRYELLTGWQTNYEYEKLCNPVHY
jgi:hypothetical protein